MKRIKQIAVALCVTACAFTTAFADESGLESATPPAPVITDPVNPQPGMLFSAYGPCKWMYMRYESDSSKLQVALNESLVTLPKVPAVKTGVDKNEKFTIECAKDVEVAAIRWEGFLKCKLAKTYTFVVDKRYDSYTSDYRWQVGYVIAINGKICIVGYGQNSFDTDLKVGFNKVEIVTLLPSDHYREGRNSPLHISAKPKGSVIEPVKLSPGMLFYDARPELTETGL